MNVCINGKGDLFEEVKRMRRHKPKAASSMDGNTEDIPGHFLSIYSGLYNEANDEHEIDSMRRKIEDKIDDIDIREVQKVTPAVLKKAASNLKNKKNDPYFQCASEFIKNGPDILFEYLSLIIRCFLSHGHVSIYLLIATIVPIIKNKLSSPNFSKNYRSVALSSLTLKLLDWIILVLHGDSLAVHELQFAYQMESSTTMCTWGAIETVGYFVRNGSEVFTCLMDNTKAFDKVQYSVLFTKLLQTSLPVVYTRVLLFIYVNQKANIRWNNKVTGFFKIRNGVRQGAILSGILYCFYTTKLVEALEDNGYGCWVNGEFCGVWSYSDDTYLIAPSLEALQNMIKTCEEFADSHSLLYSTDPDPKRCKTKCIAFLKNRGIYPE